MAKPCLCAGCIGMRLFSLIGLVATDGVSLVDEVSPSHCRAIGSARGRAEHVSSLNPELKRDSFFSFVAFASTQLTDPRQVRRLSRLFFSSVRLIW